jgi:predicted NAD/FAD-dependent oxidoreductase
VSANDRAGQAPIVIIGAGPCGIGCALETIQPWLMERGIYSRGRFGSWRYEIGNMDHAVKMGVDAARRLVRGDEEELWGS